MCVTTTQEFKRRPAKLRKLELFPANSGTKFNSDGGLSRLKAGGYPCVSAFWLPYVVGSRLLAFLPHRPTASAHFGIQRALGSGSFGSPLHELLLFMGLIVLYRNQRGFPLQPQNLNF